MAASILHAIFLTTFLHSLAAQRTNGSVPVGASLTATPDAKPWLSPSGEFAFGFQQIQGNENFLLSIWYDKIPDKTVVWYPRNGPMVSRGSKVELTSGLGLVLSDPQGRQVWSSGSISDLAYGAMNDTGNFMLVGSDSGKKWESFNFPADTLLPTQSMARNGEMTSRMSKTNFTAGRFQLRLLQDGNLILVSTLSLYYGSVGNEAAYYTSDTNDDSNSTNSGQQLIVDATGYMYILRTSGERFDLTPRNVFPSGDYYFRATLDSDGVFSQYYYPKNPTGNTSWEVLWFEPENMCTIIGSGACGLNNVCSLNARRPSCECPQGFSLFDSNDPHSDCKPDFSPSCDEGYDEDQFDFIELNDIDWPGNDYSHILPSNADDCRASCLEDCLCAVAIYRSDQCWKKKLPLSNGKTDFSLNVKAFVKRKDHALSPPPVSQKHGGTDIKVILIGVFLVLFVISSSTWLWYSWRKRHLLPQVEEGGSLNVGERERESMELPLFRFSRIVEATDNFSLDNKLGEGGFGPVYKGMLEDGQEIAVKRLSKTSSQGVDEFMNEVICISKLQHRNLVKLLGCGIKGEEKLLIYEYMPNRSLDEFIFYKTGSTLLDWKKRLDIIKGIARGLLYLHQDSRLRIIHRDLKASNILLDAHMNPKISDFGIARSFGGNETEASTERVVGTYGYMSPEYALDGVFSIKSDVFSFGVLVLEIVSGKRNRGFAHSEDNNLIGHAWSMHSEGKSMELLDSCFAVASNASEVLRSIEVGLLCVQQSPDDRPNMSSVVFMLGNEVALPKPKQPAFFTDRNSHGPNFSSISYPTSSSNELTLTEITAR